MKGMAGRGNGIYTIMYTLFGTVHTKISSEDIYIWECPAKSPYFLKFSIFFSFSVNFKELLSNGPYAS